MTLLSMAQDITDETGYPSPSSIINNSDETARKLLASLRAAGRNLARGSIPGMGTHDWRDLTKEQTFSTDGTADYDLSSVITDGDYLRTVGDTMWDRTENEKIRIVTQVGWQNLKGSIDTTQTVDRYVLVRGGSLYFFPTPPSGNTIAFEYVSNKWCQSSGGTAQSDWAADTDTGILDEYLLHLEGRWRFLMAVGLPYAEEMNEAQREIMTAMSHDGIATTLRQHLPVDVPYGNIPDTGFGGP